MNKTIGAILATLGLVLVMVWFLSVSVKTLERRIEVMERDSFFAIGSGHPSRCKADREGRVYYDAAARKLYVCAPSTGEVKAFAWRAGEWKEVTKQ